MVTPVGFCLLPLEVRSAGGRDLDFRFSNMAQPKKKKINKRVTQQSGLSLEIWAGVGGVCVFFSPAQGSALCVAGRG